jgi:hypothetical protein
MHLLIGRKAKCKIRDKVLNLSMQKVVGVHRTTAGSGIHTSPTECRSGIADQRPLPGHHCD